MTIRKRMIHPQIWEDPDFNKLSKEARLLFIGMISNADDYGYLRGDVGSLKRAIFGFDEIAKEEVEKWRKEIEATMQNVHFFENNNEQYAHHLKWLEHQKQQKDRMQPSLYPKCSKCVANAKHLQPKVKLSKDKIVCDETLAISPKSPHQEIIDFYYEAYKQQEGISYVVSGGDGKAVKEALTTKQMSPQEIKSLLRWYLERPDFKKFPTIKTALSGHFINLYRQSDE